MSIVTDVFRGKADYWEGEAIALRQRCEALETLLRKYEFSSCDGCHRLGKGPSSHCGMCGVYGPIDYSEDEAVPSKHEAGCEWSRALAPERGGA